MKNNDEEFYEWKCNYDWENNPDNICPECFYPRIIPWQSSSYPEIKWGCDECGSLFSHKGYGFVKMLNWGRDKIALESHPSEAEIARNDYLGTCGE